MGASGSIVRVGQVWLVDTSMLNGRDPKLTRPVVVVRVPDASVDGSDRRVWFVARTTDMRKRGVTHAADPRLGLSFPGVFADEYVRWGDLDDLNDADAARLMGDLDPRTLQRVRDRFGNGEER